MRLVRVVAVFFLLYTGADLLMPQYFCGGEEVADLPVLSSVLTPTTVHAGNNDLVITPTQGDSKPGQPSDKEHQAEDCFCCCAHVLPGMSFAVATLSQLKTPPPPLTTDSLPSPPLRGTYHPPRFA